MPKPFTYSTGESLKLNVTVIDERDASYPVVSIGGFHVGVPREALDRADARTTGRPQTDEERDLAEARKNEDRAAAERAKAERAAERAEREAGRKAAEGIQA